MLDNAPPMLDTTEPMAEPTTDATDGAAAEVVPPLDGAE